MTAGPSDLESAIQAERVRRQRRARRGDPLHYWQERGDSEPPRDEYWCDHCVGFYGVPHDGIHEHGFCRSMSFSRPRQCACIDCVVAASLDPRVSR